MVMYCRDLLLSLVVFASTPLPQLYILEVMSFIGELCGDDADTITFSETEITRHTLTHTHIHTHRQTHTLRPSWFESSVHRHHSSQPSAAHPEINPRVNPRINPRVNLSLSRRDFSLMRVKYRFISCALCAPVSSYILVSRHRDYCCK